MVWTAKIWLKRKFCLEAITVSVDDLCELQNTIDYEDLTDIEKIEVWKNDR